VIQGVMSGVRNFEWLNRNSLEEERYAKQIKRDKENENYD